MHSSSLFPSLVGLPSQGGAQAGAQGEALGPPPSTARILVVDDDPCSLVLAQGMLSERYEVVVACGGHQALGLLDEGLRPDLILLDLLMPDLGGYGFIQCLHAREGGAEIPVIVTSGCDEAEAEALVLSLGAVDYVHKPWRPQSLLARLRTHLELRQARDQLRVRAVSLEAEVAHRVAECLAVQNVTLHALASLAGTRDPETGAHLERTKCYVERLAVLLQGHPRFQGELSDAYVGWLVRSAPLHDIGKVGLPDHVLLKPGPLDADEFRIMQTHAAMGADAIAHAERESGMTLDFLKVAKDMARHHHERWDGAGYPDGLAGEDIPLSARLMAVADVFDALVSRRAYKAPMPFEEARRIMSLGEGTQFDPDILAAFLAHFDDFQQIALRHQDPEEPQAPAVVTLPGPGWLN